MATKSLYPYTPLKHREIRVLKTESIDELKFSLQVVGLDSARYSALSYMWGDPHSGSHISIDGCSFEISKGLLESLCQFQKGFKEPKVSPTIELLWIDAVCINQNDADEKSVQIAMMREIYVLATKVYIWLGKPPDAVESREAAAKLKQLALDSSQCRSDAIQSHAQNVYPSEEHVKLWVERTAPVEWEQIKHDDNPGAKAWKGITSMLRAVWWSRVWIYQESTVPDDRNLTNVKNVPVSTAPRRPWVTFVWGDESFTWTALMAVRMLHQAMGMLYAQELMDKHQGLHLLPQDERNSILSQYPQKIAFEFLDETWTRMQEMLYIQVDRVCGRDMALLRAMRTLRNAECFLWRDKIFAAIGLTDDPDKSLITPDYSKLSTTEDIYVEFATRFLLESDYGFDILGFALKPADPLAGQPKDHDLEPAAKSKAADPSSLDLPSWVPNWADGRDIRPLVKELWSERVPSPDVDTLPTDPTILGSTYISRRPAYEAGRGLPDLTARIENKILYVQGARLDKILVACKRHEERVAALKTWMGLINSQGGYLTGEDLLMTVHRAQSADIEFNARNLPAKRGGDILLLRTLGSRPDLTDSQKKFRIAQAFAAVNNYRKLCFTETGYIGVAPESTLPGDLVCAISGAQVLYVLRQRPESQFYEYIGECYLHGLMDGYAAGLVDNGKVEMEEFAIK